MTEEQRHAAGLADPDAQPLSDADMDRIKPTPRRRSVTRDAAPGASQSRCSARLAGRAAIVSTGAIAGFNTDGLKTLPIIAPMLSRNLGLITLKEREPTPAAIGISTLIRSVWSTGRD
jgi:hypothetical protein